MATSVIPWPIFLLVWSSAPSSLVRFFVYDEMLETDHPDQDVQVLNRLKAL
jgi:hypothetical protein